MTLGKDLSQRTTARAGGPWEGSPLQVVTVPSWRESKGTKISLEFFSPHPVTGIDFWFELLRNEEWFRNYMGIFFKVKLVISQICHCYGSTPQTNFWVRFPRHVRIFLASILLLLLQSRSMGLWGWKPGIGWVLVHKFWATSTPQEHVPKLCLRFIFLGWCLVPAKKGGHDVFSKPTHLRLVTLEEWLDVNGHTPLTNIDGWSPWRAQAQPFGFEVVFSLWKIYVSKSSSSPNLFLGSAS